MQQKIIAARRFLSATAAVLLPTLAVGGSENRTSPFNERDLPPQAIFSVLLNNPQKTEVLVVPLDNFDPSPASGTATSDPRQLKIANAFTEEPELNLKSQLLMDDPATPGVNEGIQNLARYLEKEYFPAHPDILEKFQIKEFRSLTPRQALLLSAEVAVRTIEYSNTQVEGSTKNRQAAQNEATLNDNYSSIVALLSNDRTSDGNGVCRNYTPVTSGIFAALKALQIEPGSQIEHLYVLHNQLGVFEEFPGHVYCHAWNEILYIEPGAKGRILACVTDSTWADGSSSKDPARAASIVGYGLDYTAARYLPLLERFYRNGLIDGDIFAHKLLAQAKKAGQLGNDAKVRLGLLLPTLSIEAQKEISIAGKSAGLVLPEPVKLTPQRPNKFLLKKGISEKDATVFYGRLTAITAKDPELLPAKFSYTLKRNPKELFDGRDIILGVDWKGERIRQALHDVQSVRGILESAKRETSAVLDLTYAIPKDCDLSKAQMIARNIRNYFSEDSRQYLLSERRVTVAFVEGGGVNVSDYFQVEMSSELFARKYDPARIDQKTAVALRSSNTADSRAAREAKGQILRSVHSLEESPYIGGVKINTGVKDAVTLTATLKASLEKLPQQTRVFLGKYPPNFELTTPNAFQRNEGARQDSVAEISGLLRSKEKDSNSSSPLWGTESNIIVFSDDLIRDEATLLKTVERYVATRQLLESLETSGLHLGYSSINYKFFTGQDEGKLKDTVEFLKEHKDKFKDLGRVQLQYSAGRETFEIEISSSKKIPSYSENEIKGRKGLLESLDRVHGIYAGLEELSKTYQLRFDPKSLIRESFVDFIPVLTDFLAKSEGKLNGCTITFDPETQFNALKSDSPAEIHKFKSEKAPAHCDETVPYYYFICVYPGHKIEISASPTTELIKQD